MAQYCSSRVDVPEPIAVAACRQQIDSGPSWRASGEAAGAMEIAAGDSNFAETQGLVQDLQEIFKRDAQQALAVSLHAYGAPPSRVCHCQHSFAVFCAFLLSIHSAPVSMPWCFAS